MVMFVSHKQSVRVNDYEGASTASFDVTPQTSLEDMVQGQGTATMLASYDETALCYTAFRFMSSFYIYTVSQKRDSVNKYLYRQRGN